VNDWFRSSFGEAATWGALPVSEILLHLCCSFVLVQLVAWVYIWTHHGVSYSRSYVQGLVLLNLVVTIVMLAIGNNIAGAIGLFGALALIRFRTPIKDTRDTSYLFIAVGIGIAVGSRNLVLALAGTAFAVAVAVYLSLTRFGERLRSNAVLRFAMPPRAEHEGLLRRVLAHHCTSFALMHLRDGGPEAAMEFAYRVQLDDPDLAGGLIHDLGAIPGVAGVVLLMQDEESEV
jgi:uncharacterized membrane protein YhiD involved in acid resistance